ncbi:MAG: hypothetical protein ACE5JX_07170 [Acidobacteriota bacterium]
MHLKLRLPAGSSVEELRWQGLKAATGETVALLDSLAVPGDGWTAAIRHAARNGIRAGGGPVAQFGGARASDWALYFARYYRFLPPLPAGTYHDFPAVNVFYQRELLSQHLDTLSGRFSETFFHRTLLDKGVLLYAVPEARVTNVERCQYLKFAASRFRSGRFYGARTAQEWSLCRRATAVLRSVLLPALFWGRCGWVVFQRRGPRTAFLKCTPLLLGSFVCWAAGEAVGIATSRT